ncbi:MAG: hypothetical protein J0L70_30430 [Leptolyngbya sp. UWPOB_LEPTO1]|uniref:DUF6883 domain-containing protein n=1 Tax=Leptolyngbya sp. UWPOB_LEPTO1 TaxID=2815653 RepID=UPI001AD00165|nr:DUF6883 domain-containing protein [Leptolyngbya sp. UWPOB_LEPTO1]MBN8564853.1 hypothetical protein [Leptolyngbya sp. UWPOB_LEPTO1]
MKLPNPDQALISFEKLEGYSLNPNHAEGYHKAVVCQSALDIGVAEADEVRDALRQATLAVSALQRATQDVIPIEQNAYSQKYRLDFERVRSEKQATLRSVWIVRQNEYFPRLVTCYVL